MLEARHKIYKVIKVVLGGRATPREGKKALEKLAGEVELEETKARRSGKELSAGRHVLRNECYGATEELEVLAVMLVGRDEEEGREMKLARRRGRKGETEDEKRV